MVQIPLGYNNSATTFDYV